MAQRRKKSADAKDRRNGIAKALELPAGLLSNGAHLELRWNREALIEGRCTVLEYTDTKIRINTSGGVVEFEGRGLEIGSLTSESALVSGWIRTIGFSE